MRWWYIAVPLFLLLIVALWFAGMAWTSFDGEPMPAEGYYAMIGGVVFSLVVGCGLMALVFYSSRRGYDDAAGGETPHDDRGQVSPGQLRSGQD
jgi:hypothetical protein